MRNDRIVTTGAPFGSAKRVSRCAAGGSGRRVETRALRRIRESSARLVLIAGPPGFGKTALLEAIWDDKVTHKVAIEWRGPDMIGAPPAPVTARATHIVIDDAQQANPAQFERFLRAVTAPAHGPDHSTYVIATRTLPQIDWLSLELSGRALVLRLQDLALVEDEIADLVTSPGFILPKDLVRQLHRETEGWPIAVGLYGLLRERAAGSSRAPDTELLPRAEINLYLHDQLYAGLDASMRDFLLALVDLDRFSAVMLEAAIGPDGPAWLDRAIRESLFILPARGGDGWYRLHKVFRRFLADKRRTEGACTSVGRLLECSRSCLAQGAASDAIELALRAGEPGRARDLLVTHASDIVYRSGEVVRLSEWIDKLEMRGLEVPIPLALWRVWASILMLRLEWAEKELARIAVLMPCDAPASWRAHYEWLCLSLISRRDDMCAVATLAEAWLSSWREREPFLGSAVAVLLALAHHHCFEDSSRRSSLDIARRCAHDSRSDYARAWIVAVEALIELHCGYVSLALERIETTLSSTPVSHELSLPIVAVLHFVAARVQIEAGNFEQARQHLSSGESEPGAQVLIDTHIAALEAKVLATEQSDGIDAALTEIKAAVIGGVRFEVAAKLLEVEILLRAGRTGEAHDVYETMLMAGDPALQGALDDPTSSTTFGPDLLHAKAWLALALGDAANALTLAAKLLPHAEAHGRARRQVSLQLLAAAASSAQLDHASARRYLGRAVRLAAERGLVQVMLDHSWAIRPLIAAIADPVELGQQTAPFLERVRAQLGLAPLDEASTQMLDHLTARELEILQFLDSGLTAQRVAESIGLSLATAKWHIQNIYSKLGVRNRSGALAKARRLAVL